ncbi:MAG: arginine--tRNA ligase [Bernardetiaceae bacterium]|jgi:arginyl-tRNA synthetase|nr:arginine--tRNA ligase [Bernardetiaceae bacterium]
MQTENTLIQALTAAFQAQFGVEVAPAEITLQPTKKEFAGHYTLVVFPFVKLTKKSPEETARLLGEYLAQHMPEVAGFNVVKGFLNLELAAQVWLGQLAAILQNPQFGQVTPHGRRVMVEYSSPNTNKPLHLGHLRNNFLGFSVANLMAANGYQVMKTQVVNDRGIHICKSMLAYQRFGQGETPEAKDLKGDHLVGDYYVIFDKAYKKEVEQLVAEYQAADPTADPEKLKEKAAKNAPLMQAAQTMLRQWEEGDPEVLALWRTMNQWVYSGFNATYQAMGVNFDKVYYESETYLLGKKIVDEGLARGLFFRKPDGSVWVDLTSDGLDQKLILRADGTSVYITQDFGLADEKYADFPMEQSVYVVGNEQDYHFKVLKLVVNKLGRPYAAGIYHLSYGMVELPTGRMKSREGTVVDADDLMAEMVEIARQKTQELGKIEELTPVEAQQLYHQLALGALKYYLLRVDPKKNMTFNPEESIDFQGDTGTYIQYTHARTAAIGRRAAAEQVPTDPSSFGAVATLAPAESELLQWLSQYPKKIQQAGSELAPSVMASYAYEVARAYGRFFHDLSIFNEPDPARRSLRVALSAATGQVLRQALELLGIAAPERM